MIARVLRDRSSSSRSGSPCWRARTSRSCPCRRRGSPSPRAPGRRAGRGCTPRRSSSCRARSSASAPTQRFRRQRGAVTTAASAAAGGEADQKRDPEGNRKRRLGSTACVLAKHAVPSSRDLTLSRRTLRPGGHPARGRAFCEPSANVRQEQRWPRRRTTPQARRRRRRSTEFAMMSPRPPCSTPDDAGDRRGRDDEDRGDSLIRR